MEILENVVDAIMETLEDFFDSFTIPTGKSLIQTWFVLLGFLGFSIIMWLFKFPCFLQPYEALAAVIIVGLILVIDGGVRGHIKKYVGNLRNRVVNYREVEDDD